MIPQQIVLNNFFSVVQILNRAASHRKEEIKESNQQYLTRKYDSQSFLHGGKIGNHIFWLGIANWIPLFLLFYGLQPYLKSKQQRKNCSILFVAGSFPVLLTGIGQYFFNWTGPFSIINGLIVWYQRPIQFPGKLYRSLIPDY